MDINAISAYDEIKACEAAASAEPSNSKLGKRCCAALKTSALRDVFRSRGLVNGMRSW